MQKGFAVLERVCLKNFFYSSDSDRHQQFCSIEEIFEKRTRAIIASNYPGFYFGEHKPTKVNVKRAAGSDHEFAGKEQARKALNEFSKNG